MKATRPCRVDRRRRLDYSASSYKLGLVGRGPRERTELPMFGKVEWAESSTRNLACIQLISTHAANTVTGH